MTSRAGKPQSPAPPRKGEAPRGPAVSDKSAALALTPVTRETAARLDRFVDLLMEWQTNTNLVAPST